MALDAALLESVAAGGAPVIRFYLWSPACLSLGRNQRAMGVYDPARIAAAGLDVVRRPTGGLAVLHDAELTYAVAAPSHLLGGPREAYRRIHGAIAAGLASLGAPVDLAGPGTGVADRGEAALPCFAAPAGGEVVAGGRKLVGSAQRCERRTLLQHGSILIEDGQDRIAGLRGGGGFATPAAATGLAAVLGTAPRIEVLVAALREAFETALEQPLPPVSCSAAERRIADRLVSHYRDAAWTWRR